MLHFAPEAVGGGPLSLVRDGDGIELDAAAGRLDLLVDPSGLDHRRQAWQPLPLPASGWKRLHTRPVQ